MAQFCSKGALLYLLAAAYDTALHDVVFASDIFLAAGFVVCTARLALSPPFSARVYAWLLRHHQLGLGGVVCAVGIQYS